MSPGQPIQAPLFARMTGSSAETSPPGERRQVASPSSSTTRSTGSRLATTTRSADVRFFWLRLTPARPYPRYETPICDRTSSIWRISESVCCRRHEGAGQSSRAQAAVHLDDLVAVAPADHRLVGLDPLASGPAGRVGSAVHCTAVWVVEAARQVEETDLGRDRGRSRRDRGHRRGQRGGRAARVEPGDRDVEVEAARREVAVAASGSGSPSTRWARVSG